MKLLYVSSVLICSLLVYDFWPNHSYVSEYDEWSFLGNFVIALIFLPSFFIVFFSFPAFIILTLFKNLKKAIKISIVLLIYIMVFLFSLGALESSSIQFRILVSSVTSVSGLLHLSLSMLYVLYARAIREQNKNSFY